MADPTLPSLPKHPGYGTWGDQRDGTFINPVLPGDFSDLDAIHVGSDFYAITSTMQYSPGMAVLHSNDLVNWTIVGHVVRNLTDLDPKLNWDWMNRAGRGIWAGSIRYHDGKFWVYFGTPDQGIFMSSALTVNEAGSVQYWCWGRLDGMTHVPSGMMMARLPCRYTLCTGGDSQDEVQHSSVQTH
jgi:hypothetical protein